MWLPSRLMKLQGILLAVCDIRKLRLANFPAILLGWPSGDGRHDGVLACERKFNGGLTHGVGLLHVGGGRDVAGCALQMVGHRPVILVSQRFLDHVGNERCHSAELNVTKRILAARVGQKLSVSVIGASETTMAQ